jgi:HEPN domain-containing protein
MKSCTILYSKKMYPHAVYHFQQAVEKALKSYCLGLGIVSKVGTHDTPYILLEGMFEKTGMKELIRSSSEESENLIDKAWEAKKKDKQIDIAKMPFEQIKYELANIDRNKTISEQLFNSMNTLVVKVKGRSQPPPLEITTLSIMVSLYTLGAISFPHEAFTRYPDGKMSPRNYVPELGIVKAIPDMIKYLDPAIKELRQKLEQPLS